jgi:hypothetical protein
MRNTLLISEAKIRQYSDINEAVDTKLITSAVREAQDIVLEPILGSLLYNKVFSYVEAGWVNNNFKILLEDYIQPVLIYSAYYYITENVYVRTRNNGLLTPQGGENSASVDKQMYDTKRESIKTKQGFYIQKLALYLLENQDIFPELMGETKLYQYIPNYDSGYVSPIVTNRRSGREKFMTKYGIKITNSKYKQYPQ